MSSELVKRLRAKAKLYDEIDEGEFTMLRTLMTEAADRIEALELGAEWVRDAKRYMWIRLAGVDAVISERFVNICESEPETPELFDAAIDAALAAAPKED